MQTSFKLAARAKKASEAGNGDSKKHWSYYAGKVLVECSKCDQLACVSNKLFYSKKDAILC